MLGIFTSLSLDELLFILLIFQLPFLHNNPFVRFDPPASTCRPSTRRSRAFSKMSGLSEQENSERKAGIWPPRYHQQSEPLCIPALCSPSLSRQFHCRVPASRGILSHRAGLKRFGEGFWTWNSFRRTHYFFNHCRHCWRVISS